MKSSPSFLTRRARALRREMTDAERLLWRHLRGRRFDGVKFRRQQMVAGRFIADFCALELSLVVEIDGGQHAERTEEDAQRTACLERLGFRVLRFWNNEVLGDLDGVLRCIWEAIEESSHLPHPNPLPRGRGRR